MELLMSKDKIEVNMNIYDIPILVEQLEKANKETERLNNILNELEKFIDEKNKVKLDYDGYIWQMRRPSISCNELKNKLQELKGVDKE